MIINLTHFYIIKITNVIKRTIITCNIKMKNFSTESLNLVFEVVSAYK